MGCNASSSTATADAAPQTQATTQGPSASQPQAQSQPQAPAQAQAQVQAQPQTQARQQPVPQQRGGGNLQTAKVVQSLVSLPRSSEPSLRSGADGCFIQLKFSALAPGEATLWLLPQGADDASGAETSKQAFAEGQNQSLELRVCSDFSSDFAARAEDKMHVVVELRAAAEPGQGLRVVAQRTFFKFNSSGSAAQVVKQTVSCGKSERALDPMYGTMPNPRTGASDGGEGECVICLSQPKEVVILHCRHVCLCKNCAAITSSTWSFQCPVCRGRVAAMVGTGS